MPADRDPRDPRAMSARSIREPGASPREVRGAREPRLAPPVRPQRPAPGTPLRTTRARPDANPMRLMIGLAGLASAAAFTTAMLPSVMPAPVDASTETAVDPALDPVAAADSPQPTTTADGGTVVIGFGTSQAASPKGTVLVPRKTPKPTPRPTAKPKPKPKVVARTKQSGKP